MVALAIIACLIALVFGCRAYLHARERHERERHADLPPLEEKLEVIPESDKKVRWGCGHMAWKKFFMNFWGERQYPARHVFRGRRLCPDCALEIFRRESIRCVLCGLAILPGHPVACYGGGEGLRTDIATRTDKGDWLGCLRWNCCPSGGFFAGHWNGKKFIGAFDEGRAAAAEVFATGKAVAVGDTSKKRD